MRCLKLLSLVAGLTWVAAPACPGADLEKRSVEYKIKAAFMLNFAKFVEWPTNRFPLPTSPVRIGVLGKDPFGDDLERVVAGRVIDRRKFEITRATEPEGVVGCHIVFVSSSERRRFAEVIETLHAAHVLTVGEHEHFTQQGGAVRFFLHQETVSSESTVRFEISSAATAKTGVRVSARLLQLARTPETR